VTEPDIAAILAEIDELAGKPLIQKSDVTVEMLTEMWRCADTTAITRANKKLVKPGLYETLKVFDPDMRRERRVWRKR